MRLTADMIARSPAFLNALKEREIDLRGNKIAVIENLSATQDQFDSIDLSDNEILKVESMAKLPRLKLLLLNNNRVTRISEHLGKMLPSLHTLVLTNNHLSTLTQLEPLASASTIVSLSLVDNAVAKVDGYRSFVIALLPKLRVLDFKRVRAEERVAAEAALRKGRGQKRVRDVMQESNGATPTADAGDTPGAGLKAGPTEEQVAQIKLAISNASSLEEVQKLEAALKRGDFEMIAKAAKAAGGE